LGEYFIAVMHGNSHVAPLLHERKSGEKKKHEGVTIWKSLAHAFGGKSEAYFWRAAALRRRALRAMKPVASSWL
jgi:hypothetical protein